METVIENLKKKYNHGYYKEPIYAFGVKNWDPKGPACLIDAVLSGCEFININTYSKLTDDIIKDIILIILLIPESLKCISGRLRCRYDMTALHLACINTKIPIFIIEFMLKNGANKNQTYECDGQQITILEESDIDNNRKNSLKEVFDKY
jgi:hypothetical protein